MRAAETDVGHRLGDADLPDQGAVGSKQCTPSPAEVHSRPASSKRKPSKIPASQTREHLAARERPPVDDVEDADVARPVGVVRRARVGDVEPGLVGREGEAVGAGEVVGDAADLGVSGSTR